MKEEEEEISSFGKLSFYTLVTLDGKTRYTKQINTPNKPNKDFGIGEIDVGYQASPFLVDINSDGRLDLVVASSSIERPGSMLRVWKWT